MPPTFKINVQRSTFTLHAAGADMTWGILSTIER